MSDRSQATALRDSREARNGAEPEKSSRGRDNSEERAHWAALLKGRRFWAGEPPPPPRPVFHLAGTAIATPGNLVTITAMVKSGKSAVVAAMLAAGMGKAGRDYLGFESSNPHGLPVLHFDTEHSKFDYWKLVDNALERAGLRKQPPCLYSYRLTGLPYWEALGCVRRACRWRYEDYGTLHSVFLDGVADLVANVNDPAETSEFIAELHGLAIEYDCPVVGVIHFNPGSEKTRGHLGSQLERKAETNLRLDKDADGVTVIWSDKQRRAPILKSKGPRFCWDDERGIHVSTRSLAEYQETVERESLQTWAEMAFDGSKTRTFTELIPSAMEALHVKRRRAASLLQQAVMLGVISRNGQKGYKIRAKA